MGTKATIYRSLEDLNQFKTQWDTLAKKQGNPYLSFDWHFNWLKLNKSSYEPWILVITIDDKIAAICPWVIQRQSIFPFEKVLKWSGFDSAYPTKLDILVENESWIKVKSSILENVKKSVDFDRWKFNRVAQGGYASELFITNKALIVEFEEASPITEIPNSPELVDSIMSKNFRKEFSRKFRSLEEIAPVTMVTYRNANDLKKHFDTFLKLNELRMKQKGISNSLDKVFAEALLDSGKVVLRFLKVGDKTIAASYCLAEGAFQYGYQSGFDPEFEDYSPMLVLDTLRIKELAKTQEAKFFDWGPGLNSYKLRFGYKENRVRRLQGIQETVKGKIWKQGFRVKRKLRNIKKDVNRFWKVEIDDAIMFGKLTDLKTEVPPGNETIRPMTHSDLENLEEVLGAAKCEDFAERLHTGWCMGAWLGDELVGYAWATNHRRSYEGEPPFTYVVNPPLDTVYFYDFYVFPEMRDRGTGARIRCQQIKQALYHGYKYVYLTHDASNQAVAKLGFRFGLKEIGRISYRRKGFKTHTDTSALEAIASHIELEGVH